MTGIRVGRADTAGVSVPPAGWLLILPGAYRVHDRVRRVIHAPL